MDAKGDQFFQEIVERERFDERFELEHGPLKAQGRLELGLMRRLQWHEPPFGAAGPCRALLDPAIEKGLLCFCQARPVGRHTVFSNVQRVRGIDEIPEATGFGIARNEMGAAGAFAQGVGPRFDVEITQQGSLVVTGQALIG